MGSIAIVYGKRIIDFLYHLKPGMDSINLLKEAAYKENKID